MEAAERVRYSLPKPQVVEKHIYVDRVDKPMMYDAWTQTDAPFCQKYDPISCSSPSPTELKLMEVLESLQEQLSIQTTLFQNLQQSTMKSSFPIQAGASNYRIIADGVLEPVEVEEINSELMHQVQSQISTEQEEDAKMYSNSAHYLDIKPTVAVTPNQKTPKILNFHKPLPSSDHKYNKMSRNNSPSQDPSMEVDNSYLNTSDLGNVHVSIGPNNTRVPAKVFDNIKWESPSIATRKLLTTVFDRATLATHTMTGKPSPAFKDSGKPHKAMLDQSKIKDIIFAVSRKSGVSEKEVRNVITTKCADENKMFRTKIKRESLASLEMVDNKENVYNSLYHTTETATE